VTSLPEEQWSEAEVLALYRARWHIELLFKRIKQLLDTHRLRYEHPESIKASILLVLLGWVLQDDEAEQTRLCLQEMDANLLAPEAGYVLPRAEQGQEQVISEWMLASVSLDLLRQQVHGSRSLARFRACLPRLQRFLRGSPRRRTHWYSQVGGWLRCPATGEVEMSYSFGKVRAYGGQLRLSTRVFARQARANRPCGPVRRGGVDQS